MKVQVIKEPSASRVWYEHQIGEVFQVLYETEREYFVKTRDELNTGNFIKKTDAKKVKSMEEDKV